LTSNLLSRLRNYTKERASISLPSHELVSTLGVSYRIALSLRGKFVQVYQEHSILTLSMVRGSRSFMAKFLIAICKSVRELGPRCLRVRESLSLSFLATVALAYS
jgi:hypothetical protein